MKVPASTIEHCTELLRLMADHGNGMRLTDISTALGLQKSGVHRMLNSLAKVGWVRQDEKLGVYQLTLTLTILGQRFFIASGIPDVCQPLLAHLAQETKELVRLAVVHGDSLTWISHVQGSKAGLIYNPKIMADVPVHATATGKVWLASLKIEEAVRIVLKKGFGDPSRFGPGAITNVEQLISELAETRRRGWGLAREEAEPGVCAIATTIKDSKSSVVGTVSVAGPVMRMSEERIPSLVNTLLATARDLEALWPLRSLSEPDKSLPNYTSRGSQLNSSL